MDTQIAALAGEIKTERDAENNLTVQRQEKLERLADLRGDPRLAKYQESQQAQQQSQG